MSIMEWKLPILWIKQKRKQEKMIFDRIKNINRYKNISNNLSKAIEFIENTDLSVIKEQEFQVDGKEIYGFIRSFELKDEDDVFFETHDKYIDIQLCLENGEIIGHADKSDIIPKVLYDTENDIEFGNTDRYNNLILKKDSFVIFFPNDAHKSCIKLDDFITSYKMVIKVKNTLKLS